MIPLIIMITTITTALADSGSNTTANIITAVAACFTAIGGVIGGTVLLITTLRTKATVTAVKTIVNQEKTDRLRFQEALIRALVAGGVEVPIDQSLPPVPEHDPVESDR